MWMSIAAFARRTHMERSRVESLVFVGASSVIALGTLIAVAWVAGPDRVVARVTDVDPVWFAVAIGFAVALWAVGHRQRFEGCRGWRGQVAFGLDSIHVLRCMFSRRRHLLGPLGTAVYWFGDIVCLWACLQAFTHGTPDVSLILIGYATGYALTRRTLPFGGAGAVEALLPFALSWCGISLSAAVVAVFAYRVFNLWLPIVPAALGLRSLKASAA